MFVLVTFVWTQIFWIPIIFNLNMFWTPHSLWTQQTPKLFWTNILIDIKKMYGTNFLKISFKFFWIANFLDPSFSLDPTLFWPKISLSNFFFHTSFLGDELFWTQYFLGDKTFFLNQHFFWPKICYWTKFCSTFLVQLQSWWTKLFIQIQRLSKLNTLVS